MPSGDAASEPRARLARAKPPAAHPRQSRNNPLIVLNRVLNSDLNIVLNSDLNIVLNRVLNSDLNIVLNIILLVQKNIDRARPRPP